ncbi:Protein containing HNH endonuclease domain [hydrothermal vent metagenome]|uniref:Protein containing HNH endonuclease domain n=1 Tax=hydrothermal vent metagenome TaxID=652676 RepID=A0A1W1CPE3_9ZZZZ
MVKVERKENPIFTKYNEENVAKSLKLDFNKKCYLCEEVTRHFEVDHFYPQTSYFHLINDYSNLFYCCQKCNKVKPKKINTCSDNEVLNCCEVNVEVYIKLKLNIKECKIEVTQILSDKILDTKITNTIKLLNRIYNGEDSASNSCEDLRDEITEAVASFRKKLDKYRKTKLKRAIIEEIKEDLDKSSSYSTFKRWIIRDNEALKNEFQQYIGDQP